MRCRGLWHEAANNSMDPTGQTDCQPTLGTHLSLKIVQIKHFPNVRHDCCRGVRLRCYTWFRVWGIAGLGRRGPRCQTTRGSVRKGREESCGTCNLELSLQANSFGSLICPTGRQLHMHDVVQSRVTTDRVPEGTQMEP